MPGNSTRKPVDYNKFLNYVGRRREQSGINAMGELLQKAPPGTVNFIPGLNNAKTFLIDDIILKMKDGSEIDVGEKDTCIAMNYSRSQGIPELLDWCERIAKHQNNPPLWSAPPEQGGTKVMMSAGSIDFISKVIENIVSPGDQILVEELHFELHTLSANAVGGIPVPIAMDQDGMKPDVLRKTLERLHRENAKNPNSAGIPKILCTVPNGNNPTGVATSNERRREIYQICREFDILIFEDDALWLINYHDTPTESYLSMDVDGRVIRADTFSKALGGGFRLGFGVGPAPLIQRFINNYTHSTWSSATISQVVLLKVLNSFGDLQGFENHCKTVGLFYRKQRDQLMSLFDEHLKDIATWYYPHTGFSAVLMPNGVKDARKFIAKYGLKHAVLATPVSYFTVDTTQSLPGVRMTLSTLTPEAMEKGVLSMAAAIKEAQKNGDV